MKAWKSVRGRSRRARRSRRKPRSRRGVQPVEQRIVDQVVACPAAEPGVPSSGPWGSAIEHRHAWSGRRGLRSGVQLHVSIVGVGVTGVWHGAPRAARKRRLRTGSAARAGRASAGGDQRLDRDVAGTPGRRRIELPCRGLRVGNPGFGPEPDRVEQRPALEQPTASRPGTRPRCLPRSAPSAGGSPMRQVRPPVTTTAPARPGSRSRSAPRCRSSWPASSADASSSDRPVEHRGCLAPHSA